jgi:hypothetical protein
MNRLGRSPFPRERHPDQLSPGSACNDSRPALHLAGDFLRLKPSQQHAILPTSFPNRRAILTASSTVPTRRSAHLLLTDRYLLLTDRCRYRKNGDRRRVFLRRAFPWRADLSRCNDARTDHAVGRNPNRRSVQPYAGVRYQRSANLTSTRSESWSRSTRHVT